MSDEKLLTAEEVGQRLGYSKQTILIWARKREIPAIRFPGTYRFKWSKIEKWLEKKAQLTTAFEAISKPTVVK